MIEEDAVTCKHAISLAVVTNDPIGIQLCYTFTRNKISTVIETKEQVLIAVRKPLYSLLKCLPLLKLAFSGQKKCVCLSTCV